MLGRGATTRGARLLRLDGPSSESTYPQFLPIVVFFKTEFRPLNLVTYPRGSMETGFWTEAGIIMDIYRCR